MDKLLLALGVGFVFWCLAEGVVRIIRAGKGSGAQSKGRLDDLESDLAAVEQDLEDAKQRIEVLEKIVTDDTHDLGKKIDSL